MSDDVKSKISELEKELYSKEFTAHKVEDVLPHRDTPEAPVWDTSGDTASFLAEDAAALKRHRMMKKFVKFSILFFTVAVAVAAFIWYRGSNIVSGENILIDILAPVAVSGGDPFESKFTITNNNKVAVDAATLFVEYPTGFYTAPGGAELPRTSKDLGVITPGQSISESVNTILYGEENTSKDVAVTLEYRMSGSNATLKKTTTYPIRISSSPVNIKLSAPKEISSGQEVDFAVEVGSNSKDPIATLVVEADYPSGFNYLNADPAPTYGTNIWKLSDLGPQEKQVIKIHGVIEGQESEEKATKISVGTENPKDERLIGVVYNAATESTTITKPFIAIDLAVNNNKSENNVTALNKGVRVDLLWQSNNPTKVTDVVIEVKLKGDMLDRYSLYASNGGFYRSVDNTIVWDKSVNPELASVDVNKKGSMSFSFSPVALGVNASRLIRNPQIVFEVHARARGQDDTSATGAISTFIARSIKFETELKLSATGLYYSGPFKNTGALPPQADKETTYTVMLSARNSVNNVSEVKAKTSLPIYVTWLGAVWPEGEDITYNPNTREVIWNVGRIPSGGQRDAAFQISFLPSVSHINQSPKLTGDFFIVGNDDFTKTEVRDQKPVISTYLPLDPEFGANQSSVVR